MVARMNAAVGAAMLLVGGFASGAELENFSASTNLDYGYGFDAGESMQGQLEFVPALEMSLANRVSLRLSGRLRLDYKDNLEPGEAPLENYTGASEPLTLGSAGSAELRDAYMELRHSSGQSRFGKQQIVWGRMDGIKVLDVLNPQDFREFIIDDFEDSRISLWSGYFDYTLGDWRAEVAIIPDSSGHTIPRPGAWFELTAPRFRFGSTDPGVALPTRTDQPGFSIEETGVGLRLSRFINLLNFSLVAYSGMDPEPLARVINASGSQPLLEQYYERRDTLGFSLDYGFGRAVFRAEYAYQPDRFFNTRWRSNLDAETLDQHRFAIGFDIEGPLALFANLQFLVDHVMEAPAALVRPAQDRLATFFLRRTFLYETLTFEARHYQSFTDDDQLSSLHIDYSLTEDLTLTFAAQLFNGTQTGLFGQFSEQDRLTLGLQHNF